MKKRILIVEDDAIGAKIAEHHFKNAGCEVYLVEDGSKAIELLTTHHEDYESTYMDIGIPKMNGVEVCQAVRKYEADHPDLKPIPIIAVTANSSSEDTRKYLNSGMQHVIFKPLTLEKVKIFLEKSKFNSP
jgi:CheY-like chemotaxis protein